MVTTDAVPTQDKSHNLVSRNRAGRPCKVCGSEYRDKVDADLGIGASYRVIAGQVGLSKSSIARHAGHVDSTDRRLRPRDRRLKKAKEPDVWGPLVNGLEDWEPGMRSWFLAYVDRAGGNPEAELAAIRKLAGCGPEDPTKILMAVATARWIEKQKVTPRGFERVLRWFRGRA